MNQIGRCLSNTQGTKGFSLIELLIALAVISIAMAVSVPSFRVWVDNFRLIGAANGVMDGLQRARSEAVRRNRNVVVNFTAGGWQLFVDDNGNFVRNGSELLLLSHTAPAGIAYSGWTYGGGNAHTGFNSRGMPLNSGTVTGTNQGGKTFTISLSLAGSVVKQ